MPVRNEPKTRRPHRRTSERVRAQREAIAAGGTIETRKAGGADTFAGTVISSQELTDLDRLWTLKNYPKIVEKLAGHAERLADRDFNGLDAEALYQLASTLFVLEQRLGTLLNKLSACTARGPALQALAVQKHLAGVQTAVFRRAVEMQDEASPQPVGQWVVFRDTQKKPGFHTPDAQERYYVERVRKFVAEGGDPTQIKALDADFLKELEPGQLVEYVVDAQDVARAAVVEPGKPTPGHTLLARGGDALTAGTLSVQKNAKGEVTQVLVGTFSGHFRSGLEAQQHVVRHLVAAGVPVERIVRREGQAGNPRTQEILARIIGLDGAELQRREAALVAEAYRWDPMAAPPSATARKAGKAGAPEAGYSAYAFADALTAMRVTVSKAIEDGALLSDQPSAGGGSEVTAIVDTVGRVLTLSEEAGNPLVYGQGIALLRHLTTLPAVSIDEGARKTLQKLLTRWEKHTFGDSPFDPALVFGPRPAADRRARICATINPKATETQLREMIAAGMDIARFNTAHGTTEEQVALMKRIRAAAAALGKNVTIQVDLEGPKIRLGKFENPKKLEFNDIILAEGAHVTLTTKDVIGNPSLLPVSFPSLCHDVKVGDPVFMNDGTVELRVTAIDAGAGTVSADVVMGGKVWDKKGINLPQSDLSVRTITDDDLDNLEHLLPEIDIVASSFVREAADIEYLRKKMRDLEKKGIGHVVPIIAKIERPEGLENLEKIALAADALMVARGDLGVEIGYENVPAAERRINAVGKLYGKATMVATEVLMSMVKDPSRPSRGDVEGLYAAIYDRGADAIMLGKETSFPSHPAEVVRAASRVIEKAEEERRTDPYREQLDVLGQQGGVLSARDLQRGARTGDG